MEAGVWNRADAECLVALPGAHRCLRVLVELTDDDPAAAMAECSDVMRVLDVSGLDVPILLHGENGSVWAMTAEAARRALSTRVGLEDGLCLPDGSLAPDNAVLVSAATQMLSSAGASARRSVPVADPTSD